MCSRRVHGVKKKVEPSPAYKPYVREEAAAADAAPEPAPAPGARCFRSFSLLVATKLFRFFVSQQQDKQ